jgi:hypothetical protein
MTTKIVTFRLPIDLADKLKQLAVKDGRSTNNLLIKILKEQLK